MQSRNRAKKGPRNPSQPQTVRHGLVSTIRSAFPPSCCLIHLHILHHTMCGSAASEWALCNHLCAALTSACTTFGTYCVTARSANKLLPVPLDLACTWMKAGVPCAPLREA